ncbi:Expansin-like family protein [Rhynchospora pubera]|uniref:Expansin-like family protein n=1 Tax=Rhynchospora pubera TaxID=906938 RepID=A0AAV8EE89_9POAL|nr:Expansin-like family protein [Rhynchospora pubera]
MSTINVVSMLFLFLSIASASACDWCAQQTKASFFSSPGPLNVGACGYGAVATQLYNGYIAAASPPLFREGDSCGSCFEVRCKDERLCKKEGVKVIVTDMSRNNQTGFVLSKEAFMALGHDGMAHDLMQHETLDVQFRRTPCEHNKNLSIRVEERSRSPNHLTIKFLYQGGQTDIMAVEVAQVGSLVWQYMSQRIGPIWSTPRAPLGPLRFRLVVTGGYDGKWVWTEEEVLPADWKIGELYDAKVQIKDIAQESCCPDNSYREKWR